MLGLWVVDFPCPILLHPPVLWRSLRRLLDSIRRRKVNSFISGVLIIEEIRIEN